MVGQMQNSVLLLQPNIHSFSVYLLSPYCVYSTVLFGVYVWEEYEHD